MIDVVMPQLGESVAEGTITKWLVKAGDVVTTGQAIASVATDKADSDVPAPTAGTIEALLVPEGETVRVGTPMAKLDETRTTAAAGAAAPAAPAPTPAAPAATISGAAPSVRKEALELGVDRKSVV